MFGFGSKKQSTEEITKKNKAATDSKKRELQREIKRQNKHLEIVKEDLRVSASKNATKSVLTAKAKIVVQIQNTIQNLEKTLSILEDVSSRVVVSQSTKMQIESMKLATTIQRSVNDMDVHSIQQSSMEYEREQMRNDNVSSMMDEIFSIGDDDAAEVDDLTNQVLAEVAGVQRQGLKMVPVTSVPPEESNEKEIARIMSSLGLYYIFS